MRKITKEAFVEEYVMAVYAKRDMLCVVWNDEDQQVEVHLGWRYSPQECADCIKEYVDDDYDYEATCDSFIKEIRDCAEEYYKLYADDDDDDNDWW